MVNVVLLVCFCSGKDLRGLNIHWEDVEWGGGEGNSKGEREKLNLNIKEISLKRREESQSML